MPCECTLLCSLQLLQFQQYVRWKLEFWIPICVSSRHRVALINASLAILCFYSLLILHTLTWMKRHILDWIVQIRKHRHLTKMNSDETPWTYCIILYTLYINITSYIQQMLPFKRILMRSTRILTFISRHGGALQRSTGRLRMEDHIYIYIRRKRRRFSVGKPINTISSIMMWLRRLTDNKNYLLNNIEQIQSISF